MMTDNFYCRILTKRVAIDVVVVPNFDHLFEYCPNYQKFSSNTMPSLQIPATDSRNDTLEIVNKDKASLPLYVSTSARSLSVGPTNSVDSLLKNKKSRDMKAAAAFRAKKKLELELLEHKVMLGLGLTKDGLKQRFNISYSLAHSSNQPINLNLKRGRGRSKQLKSMSFKERQDEAALIKQRNVLSASRCRKKKKMYIDWLKSKL